MLNYTENGNALITDAIANGYKIKFTKIELVADPERSGGELTHTIDIVSASKIDNTTILLKTATDNYGFEHEYYFNLINVYASGQTEEEVLFCYQKSTTCPVYIPVYDGRPIQNEISIYIVVASVDAVNLQLDGVYVLRSDFEDAIACILDPDTVTEMFFEVYFGGEDSDPTAMTEMEIEEAIRTPWNGSASEDPQAMQPPEIEEAIRTPWNGSASEDPQAMQPSEIEEATGIPKKKNASEE